MTKSFKYSLSKLTKQHALTGAIYLVLVILLQIALAAHAQQQAPVGPAESISQRQAGLTSATGEDEYLVGVGIADITGPSADINLVSLLSQLAESLSNLFVNAQAAPSASSVARAGKRPLEPAIPLPIPVIKKQPQLAQGQQQQQQQQSTLIKVLDSKSISTLAQSGGPTIATLPLVGRLGNSRAIFDNPKLLDRHILKDTKRPLFDIKKLSRTRSYQPPVVKKKLPTSKSPVNFYSPPKHKFAWPEGAASVADKKQATISLDDGRPPLMNIAYPSWRDLQNVKLQLKMGYAKPNQDAGGIHLRQFSRAIVMEDKHGTRLAYVNLDNGMVSQLLRSQVMARLAQQFGPSTFNESNVMLSATHTHSGPGGYFQYMLYNIPSAGFINQTLEALVGGVTRSVARAYASMQPARMYFHKGQLNGASINRSPTSYANNPAEERARYLHDTDKTMYLLRVEDSKHQRPLAVMSWFAVHGTSMNISNHLISSDNKGYAALLFEQEVNEALLVGANSKANKPKPLPGVGPFVAFFAQANEGDVSPNTRGPRCIDTGLPCEDATSTCGNPPRNEKCIASGPGRDMFESTKIIAHHQYYKARQLFLDTANQKQVRGPLRYAHEYIDITKQVVPLYESVVGLAKRHDEQLTRVARKRQDLSSQEGDQLAVSQQQQQQQQHSMQVVPAYKLNATYETCVAALGYSFAAGTTDGPGAFDFQQGDTASSRYWNIVRNFLRRPSDELIRCQHPKPILLSTGEMDFPYMWHPKVVPTQIFLLGQVALVGLPGEFTTMSGRRVREAVEMALNGHVGAQVEQPPQPPVLETSSTGGTGGGGQTGATQASPNVDLVSEEARNRQQRIKQSQRQAGQRLRARQPEVATPTANTQQTNLNDYEVVLSGLSNIYTSYITTIEEFEMQRYEGASTLYGPHTLQAYVNQFVRLARVLASSPPTSSHELTPSSLAPPDLTKSLFTIKPGVIYDGAPRGKQFGDLLGDVDPTRTYKCRELAQAAFVAGNPRNDLKQEQSYLYVEKFEPHNQTWQVIANDASWETKFIWERTSTIFGESKATIEWELPADCETGVYRLRHLGAHKTLIKQQVAGYEGKSSPFKVVGAEHGQLEASSREASQVMAALETTLNLAEQVESDLASAAAAAAVAEAAKQQQQQQPASGESATKSERRLTASSLLASVANYFDSLFHHRGRWQANRDQ